MVEIPQLSVAIAVPSTISLVEQATIFAGHVITGLSLSLTVTVIEQVDVFPHSSAIVHFIVDVPTG
jgi:hypothetical protein